MPQVKPRNYSLRAMNTNVESINTLATFNNLCSAFAECVFSDMTIQGLIHAYNNLKLGYVKEIETYCWFHNTGEVAGQDDRNYNYYRYKLDTGKDAHYYNCKTIKIEVDQLSMDPETISNLYNDLLTYSKGYSTKKFDLFTNIKTKLEDFLGDADLNIPSKKEEESYLNYKNLKKAKEKINKLYKEIDQFSSEGLKKRIMNKAQNVKFRVNTDIESTADTSYGYDVIDVEQRKLAKSAVDFNMTYNTYWAEFVIPSTSQMINYIESHFKNIKFDDKKLIYGIENIFGYNGIIECLGKKVEELKAELEKLKKNINGIYDAYKKLEDSAKDEFKGNQTHKKYSKTEIATKYSNLVKSLKNAGYSKKEAKKYAKKYLTKILKNSNVKITSSKVVSIYKEWKKKGKVSGNLYSKKENKKSSSSSKSTAAVATGATVVSATSSKKKKSKTTKAKTLKAKTAKTKTKNVLVGATALASIKKEINSAIKKTKEEASTRIYNAKIAAGDKKKNLEIEKNKKIAEINQKAADEISKIDTNDIDAQKRIDGIKANAEKEVTSINEQYNKDVAGIDEDLKSEIKTIENERDTKVKDLNEELNHLKTDTKSKNTMTEKVVTSAKVGATAKTVSAVSQSDVQASNEDMMNATGELSDTYEEKKYAIDQATAERNNASSNQNVPDSTPEQSNNTTDTPTQSEQESVASPVNSEPQQTTVTESSNNEPTYTSSNYSASEDYVTNDGIREDVANQATEATPETSTDTGIDQSNGNSTTKNDTSTSTIADAKADDDIVSIAGSDKTENNKSSSSGSGLGTIIPVGLGVAATGAAAVAGVRYLKNRKQNEDMDETYDDENNDLGDSSSGYEDIPSDSAYMRDDYLGPEGSTYTEVPDENSYTDAEELEEEAGMNDFSEDTALNDLN